MTPSGIPTWQHAGRRIGILDDRLARKTFSVINEVVDRLGDEEALAEAVRRLTETTRFPAAHAWRPVSLALGDPGLAVLRMAAGQVRRHPDDQKVIHRHVVAGAHGLSTRDLALFTGASGYAGTVALLAGRDRYRTLQGQLDSLVAGAVEMAARPLRADQDADRTADPSASPFDLMSGLAGWGAYLTLRRTTPVGRRALDATLGALTWMLDPAAEMAPFVVPPAPYDDRQRAMAPYGIVDCGLAHGVPGVVALLAIAALGGDLDANPRAMRALQEGARWLVAQTADGPDTDTDTPAGSDPDPDSDSDRGSDPGADSDPDPGSGESTWPRFAVVDKDGRTMARGTSHTVKTVVNGPMSRPGWCYGDTGVARAVWLAGSALGRSDYRNLAAAALRRALTDTGIERFTTATLCHGLSGLLLVATVFALETRSAHLAERCRHLTERIIDQFSGDHVVGFQDVENGGAPVDNPGLLNGAAGVAGVLCAVLSERIPAWTRFFLLA